MKITRTQLKEIIREELLKERVLKTKSGHTVQLSAVGSKVKIFGFDKGFIEISGHKNVKNFVSALTKYMRIV